MTDIEAIRERFDDRMRWATEPLPIIAQDFATILPLAERAVAAEARAEAAEALIRVLLENDPNELAADGGITVLDVWRKDASRNLKGAPDGR